jgi:hypothetical protein
MLAIVHVCADRGENASRRPCKNTMQRPRKNRGESLAADIVDGREHTALMWKINGEPKNIADVHNSG